MSDVWKHPRNVIIKFHAFAQPDAAVGFQVDKAGSKEFSKIFYEFLYFCAGHDATIRVTNEVTDAESKEPCSITAEIYGAREEAGQEMQRIGNSLMKHSTRIM